MKPVKHEAAKAMVAAITLHPRGGGVAQVSRLVWDAVAGHWGRESALLTLIGDNRPDAALAVNTRARVAFGARLARAQLTGRLRWIVFTHLGVARAQAFVPGPFRRPYAVFLHGIEVWRPLTASQKHVLRHATLRLVNSSYTAARLANLHPDIGPLDVCPLALPLETTIGLDAQAGGPIESRIVLIVGRLEAAERYKGHDQLLDAWPAVVSRVPGARLVIAGDGDDVPRLRARAVEMGVARHVTFTGFLSRPDLEATYAQAAVFAMPSRGEGFGLVYLEAMAHGLPCIGSPHDAAAEVIEDGVTGFLVDQSDTGALADRIVHLLTHPSVRREMGLQALRRVREAFTFDRFAGRFVSLVGGALEPHVPRESHSWSSREA